MRSYTRVLFLFLLAAIGTQSFAQKIGIQGGINMANMLMEDDDDTYSDDFKMQLGFNAGITFELGFGDLLSLEAGIIAENKGFKYDEEILGVNVKSDAKLLYVDVPVLVKVGPSFGPVKVFGAAGPYIGYGISGEITGEIFGFDDTEDVSWGDGDDDDFKPLDYGAKFGVGMEVTGFTIGAYYALGLANISNSTENGSKVNNRVISISVGYKFGK